MRYGYPPRESKPHLSTRAQRKEWLKCNIELWKDKVPAVASIELYDKMVEVGLLRPTATRKDRTLAIETLINEILQSQK